MTQGEIEALSREIERNARNLEIDIIAYLGKIYNNGGITRLYAR